MPTLPALISRPFTDTAPAPSDPELQVVRQELASALPTLIDLDGTRGLVLAVPLGVARAVLAADPSTVVFDAGAAVDARAYDGVWPRLTLVLAGAIGETTPVVLGLPCQLATAAPTPVAAVEVIVDQLVITAGTLRSPGRFGSQLSLRWRDLTPAPDAGPPPPVGDPSIPQRTVEVTP